MRGKFSFCLLRRLKNSKIFEKQTDVPLRNFFFKCYSFREHYSSTKMNNFKDFRFDDYGIIGFDLDGTLLRYNLNEMVPLEYEVLRNFLVENKGYSRALLDKNLDWSFIQKGLVLDALNGNLMKLSEDATILRASHGTRMLTDSEIEELYGENRKWDVATQFYNDPISTWNGPLSTQIRTLLDYFDLTASLIFAQAVDILDAESGTTQKLGKVYTVWQDVLDGLMHMYSRENFSNGVSGYFNALKNEPDRYLMRTSDQVIDWLRQLRASGKGLFLLTGSNIDFANFTASYALGADWQQLFDCVVCFAKKPGFFTMQRPYLRVEGNTELTDSVLSTDETLQLNSSIYSQGNWHQLQIALSKKLGEHPSNVRSLYLGDNLIQDVYAPVKHRDLDAVAICEELSADCDHIAKDYEFPAAVASTFWGSYFSINGKPTLWTSIISNYARLCVPAVDDIANLPISQRFLKKTSSNYYPKPPDALKTKRK